MSTAPSLAERLAEVDGRIADAARVAGRDPAVLTRIVVTKGHPASLVAELAALGVRDVGESRHQEASPKAALLAGRALRWHFIGQLQTNKARAVRRYCQVIHSVDRPGLVRALADPRGEPVDCFLQLDLAGVPGRGGARSHSLEPLAEEVLATPGLRLRGVMGVPPLGEEPRMAYARLRAASERLRTLEPLADAISAGMSGDFVEAVLEGATHLRIGTAITGKRTPPG